MGTLTKLAQRFKKDNVRTVAVVDLQWGDTGKGGLVDWLSKWADVIARGTGGANAGHTIILGGEKHVFHLVPCGILHKGKLNVIGRGVAVDPRTLAGEIQKLQEAGVPRKGLRISRDARLVLPFDIALDQLSEAKKGMGSIGTTGRGIGPVYESRLARIGLTVNDLLNKEVLTAKLKRNLDARIDLFRQFDPALVEQVCRSPSLESGVYWNATTQSFDIIKIIWKYLSYAHWFKELIVDTDELMRTSLRQKRVLLEGSQGVLLSVEYGSYPYVTSSDCSLAGLVQGVGLRTEDVDYVLGVVKAPYMTRVGKGPFPTELGGDASGKWCADPAMNRPLEAQKYRRASINATSDFEQGIAIRKKGDEYGSTTGRLRRIGWLDIPLLRYAVQYGGKQDGSVRGTIALTKVDVLSECKVIKLCTSYRYEGPDYRLGDVSLTRGCTLNVADMDAHVLQHSVPVYTEYQGWCSDLSKAKKKTDLPAQLIHIIEEIERLAQVRVDVLSIGPDREDTIVL